jgi:FkbM family methyltransferase
LIPQSKRENYATTLLNSLGYGETSIKAEVKAVLSNLKDSKSVVLDIGSSKGDWSRELLENSNNLMVYAFEPSPTSCSDFEHNLNTFIKSKRCVLRNVGLSTKSFKGKIYAEILGSGAASLYLRKSKSEFNFEYVQIKKFDAEIKKIGLPIVAMKIDTEGHELEILLAARKLMQKKYFKAVQFEFGEYTAERNQNFKTFYELLSNLNFTLFRVSNYGLRSLNEYSPKLEIHWNTNYLAIKNDS